MDAVAFFLLAVSLTLIVVGLSRLLAWFLDRRAFRHRSELSAVQMVTAAQMRLQRHRVALGRHPITGAPR